MSKRFVIVAPGRSGTGYVSQIMKAHGIECGHETYFNTGKQNYNQGSDSSWLAVPFLHKIKKNGYVILHQIRDPLKTMNSILKTMPKAWWKWILKNGKTNPTDPITEEDQIKRTVNHWFDWHKMIEQYADYRYKVEEMEKEWPKLMELIDEDKKKLWKKNTVPTDYNTRRRSKEIIIKRTDLPPKIKSMIWRYGYLS